MYVRTHAHARIHTHTYIYIMYTLHWCILTCCKDFHQFFLIARHVSHKPLHSLSHMPIISNRKRGIKPVRIEILKCVYYPPLTMRSHPLGQYWTAPLTTFVCREWRSVYSAIIPTSSILSKYQQTSEHRYRMEGSDWWAKSWAISLPSGVGAYSSLMGSFIKWCEIRANRSRNGKTDQRLRREKIL